MSLAPGTRLGPYEITAQIDVGGMGEVYRATDTNLKRSVAIKVLPESVAADVDRLARFQREAEVLAALNHLNIAAIYGLERSGATTALVMELVEGPTLADRITQGAVPIDEALPIAKQIAEALEAAHEQGIIHRDLKPANIKVRSDGTVKVLDFGLAKAIEPVGAMSPNASMSPTITSPAMMTGVGMILGTAAYMSPEQARAKPLDRRSDIWAFGCVMFEMLTGRRAFGGDDVPETFVAIVRDEPDWSMLPATLSPALGLFIRRCLHKNSRQRIADVQDIRLALEGAFDSTAQQTTAATAGTRGRPLIQLAFAGAVIGMIAMAVPAVQYLREPPSPSPPETRTEIVTPPTGQPTMFALSPDGRQIVFVASNDGASRLWLRVLTTTTARPVSGTEGALYPFWSPDSRSVAFFAEDKLKRLDLGGGAPQTLASASNGSGGTWGADGVIVFATSITSGLMRVSATGGSTTVAMALDPQHIGYVHPHFLPDGRRFLFYARGTAETAGIYLSALNGSSPTRLTAAEGAGVFLPSGWLLWVRAGTQTLVAQRLAQGLTALTGEPMTLADGVAVDDFRSPVSVADSGLVAYRTGISSQRQLIWVDRSGTPQGTLGDPENNFLTQPRVSPDGRRVVVARTVEGNQDLWLMDGTRTSRFTFDGGQDYRAIWSPDGTRIVFRSNRTRQGALFQKFVNGAGPEEQLVAPGTGLTPSDWSRDGRFLLYFGNVPGTVGDVWLMPMVGDRKPFGFMKTPFNERWGVFSPDGRWVAYFSNESGRDEIYVRPFVRRDGTALTSGVTDGQWQVSPAGGVFPMWRPDGRELYYLNPAGAMMAAPITITGGTLEPGAPVVLFPTRIYGGGEDVQLGRQYDVAPDGRFLINAELDKAAEPITLLQNWNPEAKK